MDRETLSATGRKQVVEGDVEDEVDGGSIVQNHQLTMARQELA